MYLNTNKVRPLTSGKERYFIFHVMKLSTFRWNNFVHVVKVACRVTVEIHYCCGMFICKGNIFHILMILIIDQEVYPMVFQRKDVGNFDTDYNSRVNMM